MHRTARAVVLLVPVPIAALRLIGGMRLIPASEPGTYMTVRDVPWSSPVGWLSADDLRRKWPLGFCHRDNYRQHFDVVTQRFSRSSLAGCLRTLKSRGKEEALQGVSPAK